jgi:pyridoxine kinase
LSRSQRLKKLDFYSQTLGFEVDTINSVQFSNHTGYDTVKGQVLNAVELQELYDGLAMNKLDSAYSHLLTGYVGNDTFLQQIGKIVKKLR